MGRFLMFSSKEVKDIVISLVVLSVVFAYPLFIGDLTILLFSFFAVGIAFMGHELSHRFVAKRLGYWAEYRRWDQGLMLAVLLTVISGGGFVFAAPGAVVFSSYFGQGRPSRSDIGRIGIAGVVFNISLMFILYGISLFYPSNILLTAAFVNGWLAIFNLIPFGPLDGAKVLRWNIPVWVATFGLAIAGVAIYFFGLI